jgi:ABC-type sugar transport system substrate-binding protein
MGDEMSEGQLGRRRVMGDRNDMGTAGRLGAGDRFSRRKLLARGGTAGLGALALASGLSACGASSTPTASQQSPGPTQQPTAETGPLGKKRTIVWPIAAIGDWNLPVDVGFNDAVRMVGWEYQKVGLPIAQYNAENQVNTLEKAILTKPDVLVVDWWVKGEAAVVEKAQKAGIFVICNDADNFPDDRKALGIARVGSDFHHNGYVLGQRLADTVAKSGKTSGVFLSGIAYPGNTNVEDKAQGVNDAVQDWNKAHNTSFTFERFPDQSAGEASVSSGLYSAKITQLGSTLVAAEGDATSWPTIVISTLQAKGFKPGQVALGAFRADPPAVTGIKDGWITASADESFYPFGFVATLLAWQYLERGLPPNDYISGGGLIDQTNLAEIEAREAKVQDLAKQYGVKLT